MALIVSRAILFLILALAFGIATVFPEQKLPLYIVFTLFVAVAIVSNVWFTHQNVKKHIIKFNKYVAYFLSFVSGLLYIGFVIYTLTIGSYDVFTNYYICNKYRIGSNIRKYTGNQYKKYASIKQTVESHLQATCSAI